MLDGGEQVDADRSAGILRVDATVRGRALQARAEAASAATIRSPPTLPPRARPRGDASAVHAADDADAAPNASRSSAGRGASSRRRARSSRAGGAARTRSRRGPPRSPAPAPVASRRPAPPPAPRPLPPVESLTFDSDFAAFFQPKVDGR